MCSHHAYINFQAICQEQVGQSLLLWVPLPSDVQSFHFVDDVFLVGLFVIYCCVTDYHKFGSLKHHTFTLAVFKGQKVRHGLTGSSAQRLTSLSSQCLWGINWRFVSTGGSSSTGGSRREESASSFSWVVDRLHFFAAVALHPLFLSRHQLAAALAS